MTSIEARTKEVNEIVEDIKEIDEKIDEVNDEELDKEVSWRFKEYLPKLGDLLAFMCIQHSSMHLAQLSAWRRSKGFDSALKKM